MRQIREKTKRKKIDKEKRQTKKKMSRAEAKFKQVVLLSPCSYWVKKVYEDEKNGLCLEYLDDGDEHYVGRTLREQLNDIAHKFGLSNVDYKETKIEEKSEKNGSCWSRFLLSNIVATGAKKQAEIIAFIENDLKMKIENKEEAGKDFLTAVISVEGNKAFLL